MGEGKTKTAASWLTGRGGNGFKMLPSLLPYVLGLLLTVIMIAGCGGDNGSSGPGSGPAPGPGSECATGNLFTFINDNSYPIWLAEAYQGSTSGLAENTIAPPGHDWKMTPKRTVKLCIPAGWTGRFWPRTECNFDTLFGNDSGYKSCTSDSQCATGHLCYGGKCMLDCSPVPPATAPNTPFCQGTTGLNNPSAVCISISSDPAVDVCSYPQGTVCKTGDCEGLFQCYGSWDNSNNDLGELQATGGSGGPVSLV